MNIADSSARNGQETSQMTGPPDRGDFYVGYLKMPATLRAFVIRVLPVLLAATAAVAFFLSYSQGDPGNGVWEDNALPSFVGRAETSPYPLIRVSTDDRAAPVATMLLVGEGKHGGSQSVEALAGRFVRIEGTVLTRDHVQLLEVAKVTEVDPRAALASKTAARLMSTSVEPLGKATLRGEIIDPKCYCGAMKPGEGKTHKACATLCISGGIPPMFVTFDTEGRPSYYLLTNPEGGPLDDRILPFVADPVEITGVLERRYDLTLFKIDPADVVRL